MAFVGRGSQADLDVEALRAMASSPAHVHMAPDAAQLVEVYRAIAVAWPPSDLASRSTAL